MVLADLEKGMKVIHFKMKYYLGYNEKKYKEEISKKNHYLYSIQSMIDFGYALVKYVDYEHERVLITHEDYLNRYSENEAGNWYKIDEFELFFPKENKQYLLGF